MSESQFAVEDEMEALMAQVGAGEDPGDPDDDFDLDADGETGGRQRKSDADLGGVVVAAPARKRRRSSRSAKETTPKTLEELDAESVLPAQLPEPAENVKMLSNMYAKYKVGENPEFKVRIYRIWPKVFAAKSIDGLIDTLDEPIDEDRIHQEYGGGTYRVTVIGPNPQVPNLPKHYDSHTIKLSGDPNMNRLPKALQGNVDGAQAMQQIQNPPPLYVPQENPKLVEHAFKMIDKSADREREERMRIEEKLEKERERQREQEREVRETAARAVVNPYAAFEPVVDAERRRAEEVIKAQKERYDAERAHLEREARESRQSLEEVRRRMETMESRRPSVGDEIRSLAESGLLKQGDDGAARVMVEKMLDKHQAEIQELQRGHADFVRSVREGHEAEKAAIRSAHERELSAERESARARESRIEESAAGRESRIEERLAAEREERRRDQDRFRQQMEDRDRQWTDRLEQSKALIESTWLARHSSEMSAKDNRIEWLSAELDRLRGELAAEKTKHEDKGDVFTQLDRLKQMREVIGDFAEKPAVPPSGGIGMGGTGGGGWQEMLAEGVGERLPDIINAFLGNNAQGPSAGAPAAPQPQFVDGQEMQTPQGVMVVVRDPATGQQRLARKEDIERFQQHMLAQQRAQAQQRGQQAERTARRSRQQSMPDLAPPRSKHRSRGVSVTPNLMTDPRYGSALPERIPPWEGGTPEEAPSQFAPPPPPLPPPQPMVTQAEASAGPLELSSMERQALKMVAQEVERSVLGGEEPEEFVERVIGHYPSPVLHQIVGGYTDRQIATGVRQVHPDSAGATPLGQEFIGDAFRRLRAALADA